MLTVQMRAELVALHERLKSTMIYVTHDQVEAMTMADRIVVLRSGQAEQIGAPLDLYRNPRNAFVAGFIGSPKMNFIPVTVSTTGPKGITVDLPGLGPLSVPVETGSLKAGDKTTLGIRPEHLQLGAVPETAQLSAMMVWMAPPPTASQCAMLVLSSTNKGMGAIHMEITTLGIDIAKSVFQLHGVDGAGEAMLRKRLRRNQVLKFMAQLPRCLVGIEACGTSHHWAREISALGHDVRLIPPTYVKCISFDLI